MKFVLAPDSFKGSLTAKQACDAIEKGILKVFPDAEVISLPLADGGEGTVETLVNATEGKFITVPVTDPLGNEIDAVYGILGNSQTAVIEMAAASGLTLIPEKKQNPLYTTTYGTGELIKHALDNDCKRIIIGIGGSATIDGGAGMAQALGVEFFDEIGKKINTFMSNEKTSIVADISLDNLHPRVKYTSFIVACDVENPLLGVTGATYVYARQKGAQKNELPVLEENMSNFYDIVESKLDKDIRNIPGAGAAGGLGAGLMAFLNARLEKGIDFVLDTINFKSKIQNATLIFTGEGSIDEQTSYGKTISGILKIAAKQKIPVVALAGSVGNLEKLHSSGLTSAFSICNSPLNPEIAMERADELICQTTEQICRLIQSKS